MMRKLFVAAVAVGMSVPAVLAVSAVGGAGVAGAAPKVPGPITCDQTGTVTFASPGLSYAGSLTKKASEKNESVVSASGTGCNTKSTKLKITGPTTPCATAPHPPAACTDATSKDPNYYDNASSYSDGTALGNLENALQNGIKTTDDGAKVVLEYGSASQVLPKGACGSAVGFQLSGDVNDNGGPSLTYTDTICLVGDSGTHTTDSFVDDLAGALGGGDQVISSATIGGDSQLVISSNVVA